MTVVTIELSEKDYERLEQTALQAGKTVQDVIQEWVAQLPGEPKSDLAHDPIYQFEGYDADAPYDLAENLDTYLYRKNTPL